MSGGVDATGFRKLILLRSGAKVGCGICVRIAVIRVPRVGGYSRFGAGNPTISQLKLRSSYGITGNTEIGSYQSLATVGSRTTLINGQRVTSTIINGLANPDLQWERTE